MISENWITLNQQGLNSLTENPPNCLLFVDPQIKNASLLAQKFIAATLCEVSHQEPCGNCQSCHLFAKNTHPDAIWITELGKIDEIRQLIQKINLTPTIAKKRLIFLGKIDHYNDFALSALLKTLEEPSEHSSFILSAYNSHAVKPTILSRAQTIHVKQPSHQEALNYMVAKGILQDKAANLLLANHGNPYSAIAHAAMNNADPFALLEPLSDYLASPRKNTVFLQKFEQYDSNRLLDDLCLNIEQIIIAIQLQTLHSPWNQSKTLAQNLPLINTFIAHRLYAKLCALRRPNQQQLNQVLAIKAAFMALLQQRRFTL